MDLTPKTIGLVDTVKCHTFSAQTIRHAMLRIDFENRYKEVYVATSQSSYGIRAGW